MEIHSRRKLGGLREADNKATRLTVVGEAERNANLHTELVGEAAWMVYPSLSPPSLFVLNLFSGVEISFELDPVKSDAP